jgi:NADH-quinone oxidoreductase subunit J
LAIGVCLLLRHGSVATRGIGVALSVGGFLGALGAVSEAMGPAEWSGEIVFFYIFSAVGIASAIRMITHQRPVYAALYFVMVILSTCGLLLLLKAEFMAFAVVIVYAGAILITYMFVLMLAQQAPDPDHPQAQAIYDTTAREPGAAAAVGFMLLALIVGTVLRGIPELPAPASTLTIQSRQVAQLQRTPLELKSVVLGKEKEFVWPPHPGPDGDVVQRDAQGWFVEGVTSTGTPAHIRLTSEMMPDNTQHVGWDLVARFPASLEIAGVILLLAMFGAVVLARRQIEHTEEELRVAAGMKPLLDSDDQEGAPS